MLRTGRPRARPSLITGEANGSVILTWNAPDDGSVTGYQVLRSTKGETALSVYVENTGSTATTLTDADVTADTFYAYRVKAINGAGVGQRSRNVRGRIHRQPITLYGGSHFCAKLARASSRILPNSSYADSWLTHSPFCCRPRRPDRLRPQHSPI